jgi:hypothetical protein
MLDEKDLQPVELVEELIEEPIEDPEQPAEEPIEEPAEEPVEEPKKDFSVPGAKYMAEKKKRQELEKILANQKAEQDKLRIVQEYISQGYPEPTAIYHAEERVRQSRENDEVKSRLLDLDIRDLTKSDSFFADAMSYKDEIKEKIRQYGIGAEEAYMMIRGPVRTREIMTQQEQLNANKRRQVEHKKVTNSTPAAPQNPYKLDEVDKRALAGLQKAQPEVSWTAEKYYKLMKS